MYTKGLAINNHLMAIAISLTAGEIIRLGRRNADTENNILDQISDQIKNTEKFIENQDEPKSFAKGMNQAPNGAIILVVLTDSDVEKLKDEDEEVENRILNSIDSQAQAIFTANKKAASTQKRELATVS